MAPPVPRTGQGRAEKTGGTEVSVQRRGVGAVSGIRVRTLRRAVKDGYRTGWREGFLAGLAVGLAVTALLLWVLWFRASEAGVWAIVSRDLGPRSGEAVWTACTLTDADPTRH